MIDLETVPDEPRRESPAQESGQDCVGLDGVERNERISRSHVSSCLPCFVHSCLQMGHLDLDPFGLRISTCQYQSPVLLYI